MWETAPAKKDKEMAQSNSVECFPSFTENPLSRTDNARLLRVGCVSGVWNDFFHNLSKSLSLRLSKSFSSKCFILRVAIMAVLFLDTKSR